MSASPQGFYASYWLWCPHQIQFRVDFVNALSKREQTRLVPLEYRVKNLCPKKVMLTKQCDPKLELLREYMAALEKLKVVRG